MAKWSDWYSLDICSHCKAKMNLDQKMYANGTCYACGYTVPGTSCAITKVTVRHKRISPWWRFWNRKHTIEHLKE